MGVQVPPLAPYMYKGWVAWRWVRGVCAPRNDNVEKMTGKGQRHMVKVEVKEEEKCMRTLEVELPPEKARQQREEVVSEVRR